MKNRSNTTPRHLHQEKKENANTEFIKEVISKQATILTKLGYYKEAIEFLKSLLKLGIASGDSYLVCLTKINIGSAYLAMGNTDTANKYFKSALEYAKEKKSKRLESLAYMRIGTILNKDDYIKKAEDLLKKINNIINQTD